MVSAGAISYSSPSIAGIDSTHTQYPSIPIDTDMTCIIYDIRVVMSSVTHEQPGGEVPGWVERVAAVVAEAEPQPEHGEAGHPRHQGRGRQWW